MVFVCLTLYEISISVEIRGEANSYNGVADMPSWTRTLDYMALAMESTESEETFDTSGPFPTISTSTVIPPLQTSFTNQLDTYFNSLSEPSTQTQWIREYVIWHNDIRRQFPDTQLFDHPEGPRLMIAWYHPGHRSGLTDRSKCLGDLLQQAYEAKRILLLKWFQAPFDLETFLEPQFLNFTLPHHPTTKNTTILTETYERSTRKRQKRNQRIVQARLKQDCDFDFLSPFHVIWHVLFRPSPSVRKTIHDTMTSLKLSPGKYDAVHCRVTHPAFWGNTRYGSERQAIDSQGAFEFKDDNKKTAVEVMIHGVQCASRIRNTTFPMIDDKSNEKESVYLFSDSHDLIRFMVQNAKNASNQESDDDLVAKVTTLQSKLRIVGRSDASVVHLLNSNEETPFDAFVSTFVDIYIASYARCLSLGVGNYAFLSAKIKSGDVCWVRHQVVSDSVSKKWGMVQSTSEIPTCAV